MKTFFYLLVISFTVSSHSLPPHQSFNQEPDLQPEVFCGLTARCAGSSNCKACKTCERCAYCSSPSRSCSVCAFGTVWQSSGTTPSGQQNSSSSTTTSSSASGGSYSAYSAPSEVRLSLTQLQHIVSRSSYREVRSYLLQREWELYSTDQNDDGTTVIMWSYGRNSYDDRASAWLAVKMFGDAIGSISYQVFDYQIFRQIENQLSTQGYRETDLNVFDDNINLSFSNRSYYLQISESTSANDLGGTYTSYIAKLVKKGSGADRFNGEKKDYWLNGELRREYTLKDGNLVGAKKVYDTSGELTLVENWKNGKLHGVREEYENGVLVNRATFQNGTLNGPAEYLDEDDGFRYRGKALNGSWHGERKIYAGDRLVRIEHLLEGKLHGEEIHKNVAGEDSAMYTYDHGGKSGPFWMLMGDTAKIVGSFLNDQFHEKVSFFLNGSLYKEITFQEGIEQGPFVEYYQDTNLIFREGSYHLGEKDQEWKHYTYSIDEEPFIFQFDTYQKGQLHGPSYEYSPDSIVIRQYHQGELDGRYLVYEWSPLLAEEENKIIPADTSLHVPRKKGHFRRGKKHGHWESYALGFLLKEGNYRNDTKTGLWKRYTIFGERRLVGTTQFSSGQKEGEEHSIFDDVYTSVPCEGEQSDLDSCFDFFQSPLHVMRTYQTGNLSGPTWIVHQSGDTLQTGYYQDNLQHGLWKSRDTIQLNGESTPIWLMESYKKGDLSGPAKVVRQGSGIPVWQGSYSYGLQAGEFVYYYPTGQPIRKIQYDRGELTGAWIETDIDGNRQETREYYQDELQFLKVPVEMRNGLTGQITVKRDFQGKLHPSQSEPWIYEIQYGDTLEVFQFLYQPTQEIVDSWPTYPVLLFDILAEIQSTSAPSIRGFYQGEYEMLVAGLRVVNGAFFEGIKAGKWITIYRDQKIYQELLFEAGKRLTEKWLDDATNEPFSGTAIVRNPRAILVQEIKVKNGLRHGKTKFFNALGDETSWEKYSKGTLVKKSTEE